MENRLLTIGTIVEKENYKFCVIGYGDIEEDEKIICGYYVVSYPLGYLDLERTFFIPKDTEMKVIAMGYRTEASDNYLELMEKAFLEREGK